VIDLFKVSMNVDEAMSSLKSVLDSGYIGEGSHVKEFEENLKCHLKFDNVACVNSGTSALTLALHVAGVGHGDYVVSTPITCLATNMAILSLGAKIIWADVFPDTGLINPLSVAEAIKENPVLPSAVMCVDYAGALCDYEMLREACCGIPLIADAAHSLMVGGADFTCFSFQAIKHLTTGDGGAIACLDEEDHERVKLLRWFGLNRDTESFRCVQNVTEYGFKFQMNNISAAIGNANMEQLNRNLDYAWTNAFRYDTQIKNEHVKLIKYNDNCSHWLYVLHAYDTDAFIKHMKEKGIACSKVHDRNDNKELFKEFKRSLKGVDEFARTQVAIPVGWWLSSDDVDYIIKSVNEF
jgi:dTDP-4-amino-4,6-dideoxygalactose transaminase